VTIAAVRATGPDPLEQLSQAVLAAEHLGEVADHLVGHFVDQARRRGSSWSQIGGSMGVTKQAAQKRFVGRSADRTATASAPDDAPAAPDPALGFAAFTGPARDALAAAHNAAVAAGSARVTPAHLTLGLLDRPDTAASTAVAALRIAGVDPQTVDAAARDALPPAVADAPAVAPYDDDARAVLEACFAEAARTGAARVGTGELLLSLLRHESGTGPLIAGGLTAHAAEAAVAAAPDEADDADEAADADVEAVQPGGVAAS